MLIAGTGMVRVSDIEVRLESSESGTALHVRGKVSLENNGGFIQARLILAPGRRPFGASLYRGLEMRVRGTGDSYFVHLRTPRTLFPWSYYVQTLPVREDWNAVRLPFEEFRSVASYR